VKISVVAFDLSDNATGRADLLARLLAARWDVEVVGPRFGPSLWKPAEGGPVKHRTVRAGKYPGFLRRLPALLSLVDGDLIVASKPRPTSYGLGLLARSRRRRPLLLDIDDWELGFLYRSGVWGRVGRALDLADPNGLAWTWVTERLVGRADALTVASRFLAERFGVDVSPYPSAVFEEVSPIAFGGIPFGEVGERAELPSPGRVWSWPSSARMGSAVPRDAGRRCRT